MVAEKDSNRGKDWKIEEQWFTNLRARCSREATRMDYQEEDTSGGAKVKGLTTKVEKTLVRCSERGIIDGETVDLEGISLNLLKHAAVPIIRGSDCFGPLQKRAIINITFHAVGRGGEVKLVRIDEMTWDFLFQSPDCNWKELKTLTDQCMLFSASRWSYLCDFFHSLGLYFACEHGLFRSNPSGPTAAYLFPALHRIATTSAAKYLTEWLQDEIQPRLKKGTTSRSLRKGSATVMMSDNNLNDSQINDRGGWSSGSNSDSYRNSNPAMNLPGGRVLAGWPAFHHVQSPRLECLGEENFDAVESFLKKPYVVNVTQFQ